MQVEDKDLNIILKVAREALGCDGDFVELGCYKGDTSVELARIIRDSDKALYLYDSFIGMPTPTSADGYTVFKTGDLATRPDEVMRRFKKYGLSEPFIIQKLFENLEADDLPEKIAFAFLDGDLYSSIKSSLRVIELKSPAHIVIHDFNNSNLPGVRKATLEWLREHREYSLRAAGALAILARKG
jgi:O-methyltransferase